VFLAKSLFLFFFLLIVVGTSYINLLFLTDNPKSAKEIFSRKSREQRKAIKYFSGDGCNLISDCEYCSMVKAKKESINIKQKAIDKICLYENEVSEIQPAIFEGYVFDNAHAKRLSNGSWVSSSYQVSLLFFSSIQIYRYIYTFNMEEDIAYEYTDKFFYKDIESFSTLFKTEIAQGLDNNQIEIQANRFVMDVPGNRLIMAMDGVTDPEPIIQVMKQLITPFHRG